MFTQATLRSCLSKVKAMRAHFPLLVHNGEGRIITSRGVSVPTEDSRIEAGRQQQVQAYGEPLSEAFSRYREAFGLNQSELAIVLGISAPMLSQLNSGQRVKIGNPAVMQRLQRLEDLVGQIRTGALPSDQIPAKLEEVKASTGRLTRSTTTVVPVEADDDSVVAGMRNLLRAVASGQEIRSAAEALKSEHPGLAEVLRLYGTGSLNPAREHYSAHKELF